VKDHRTKTQTAQVYDVLDGDIDMFIEAELRNQLGRD
jgi:protein subunit release factor B